MSRACLTCVVLIVSSAFAQSHSDATSAVRVRFTFANGGCYPFTRVLLIGADGPLAESMPDEQCQVSFEGVPAGTYHVKASGLNLDGTDSLVASSKWSADLVVHVKALSQRSPVTANSLVSAADLRVPAKAQKEFAKAAQQIARKDFAKALQSLRRAIAIDPSFAGAYNNLGVIYQHLGDETHERDALQKAVDINDKYSLAYLNLGKMGVRTGDFPGAEDALRKATALISEDYEAPLLLAYAELMNGHLEDALATSRKMHTLAAPHSFAHRIAARALEQQGQNAAAAAELESYLAEEPAGSRSGEARKELEKVRSGNSIADTLTISDLTP